MTAQKKIELLAPAKDLDTGKAAVDYGADAVYIGGPGFGARRAAGNPVEDIAALVRYARPFGVRVYAALNTILYDSELDDARGVASEIVEAGADALIVQDMAYLRMGLGAVEFHASTQTSNILPEDAAFLGRAGFSRLILERALTLSEIEAIGRATEAEIEVFIHGAICVGYSGRCFMSRSTGPRSGNRGECSQPCRLAYDLTDDRRNVIIKGKHLLSVRDLDLSQRLPELLRAGVTSFKIEGRLKDTNYIKNTVSHYRALIDRAIAAESGLVRASAGESTPDFTPDPSRSFTRGSTDYFLNGVRRGVASFDTPKSIGAPVGVVASAGNGWFTLRGGSAELSPGDGICFLAGGELRGTNVNRAADGRVYPNRTDGITPGTEIFRNHDHAFDRLLERSRVRRRIRTSAAAEVNDTTATATFTDITDASVKVSREGVFEAASDPAKMRETIREQLSKSGATMFDVTEVEPGGGVRFVPASVLASMRREGLEKLERLRRETVPARRHVPEDLSARFPRPKVYACENVANRLAERFYRDHGAVEIEPGLDLSPSMDGQTVMRTRYCIRRELGECLRENPCLEGPLRLERGRTRYDLEFDCSACEMRLVYREL